MPTPTLIAALGNPPVTGRLPSAHSAAWALAKNSLRRQLEARGCRAFPRSPASLHSLATGASRLPPPGATWASIVQAASLDDLVARLRGPQRPASPQLLAWNVRWMQSTHTDQAARKKGPIAAAAARGDICLLQETHWYPRDAALWGGLFPQATLYHSPARPGPEGGPQGGVAILLPSTWEVQDVTALVPACALQVTARRRARGSAAIRFHSIYFPP